MPPRFPALSAPVSYPSKTVPPRGLRLPDVLSSLPLMELCLFAALGLVLALG